MTKTPEEQARDFLFDVVLRSLIRDPKQAGTFTKALQEEDPIGQLGKLLRRDEPQSVRLLYRVIAAAEEDPLLHPLAVRLRLWHSVQVVESGFKGPKTKGRREKAPIVTFLDRHHKGLINLYSQILKKWEKKTRDCETKSETLSFITAEWKAGRFPYTREELVVIYDKPLNKIPPVQQQGYESCLPRLVRELHEIRAKKEAAFWGEGGERKANPRYLFRAARVYFEGIGRRMTDDEITRYLGATKPSKMKGSLRKPSRGK